ncbi:hypothetical protein ABZ926_12085 [Streptomyces litmocidini]|uniref:Uncharacterized protein n=1 Tax=Streptomyces litmocidini TaxID=67318 RepID=A0ABW7U828_9ACTN|nr:hypothetical protein [Streptomyces sp. PanSC19]ROQ35698.1 hypothetical protein EDD98_4767 [Streptomyces sp. PanSC19]
MITVAVLLLPVMGLMLYGLDRIEDRVLGRTRRARHAAGRHLRLVQDTDRRSRPDTRRGRHRDAA